MSSSILFRIYEEERLIKVKQYPLAKISIGSAENSDLVLSSDLVATEHALIELIDGKYIVRDLGSDIGTILNGELVTEAEIKSSDKLYIGSFRVECFISVKPASESESKVTKTVKPTVEDVPVVTKPVRPPKIVKPIDDSVTQEIKLTQNTVVTEVTKTIPEVTEPVVVEKAVEVEEQVVIAPISELPAEVKEVSVDQFNSHRTYAPPTQINDILTVLTPEKGTVVEVSVVWNNRVIASHHFTERGIVEVGPSPKNDIILPLIGFSGKSFSLLKIDEFATVFLPKNCDGDLYHENSKISIGELLQRGKAKILGEQGYGYGLQQGEMLHIKFHDGLSLVVRYIPETTKTVLLPFINFATTEALIGVFSLFIVGLMSLYMYFSLPSDLDSQDLVEQPLRQAKVMFKKIIKPKDIAEPEKVKVTKVKKRVQVKEKSVKKSAGASGKSGAVAGKNNKSKVKKIRSIKKGGAVKVSKKSGSSIKTKPKKKRNLGIGGTFGSGGAAAALTESAGAGGLVGDANSATGYSGQNKDRIGKGLGSSINDVGAGGSGSNSYGSGNIGTKGKGTGSYGYGTGGSGKKLNVNINVGGGEADFVGSIDKEAIRRVIRRNKRNIAACYNIELRANHELQGKIVLKWDIEEKGKATNVRVKSASRGLSGVAKCIINRLRTWRFPEPAPGTIAEVSSYPFSFNSK